MARKRPRDDDDFEDEDDEVDDQVEETRRLRKAVEDAGHGREPLILGLIGGLFGLVALCLFCIPFLPLFIAGVGVVICVIGIILAATRSNIGLLFPCLGLGGCMLAICINGAVSYIAYRAGKETARAYVDAKAKVDAQPKEEVNVGLGMPKDIPAAAEPTELKEGNVYALGYRGKRDVFGVRNAADYANYKRAKAKGSAAIGSLEGDGKLFRMDADTAATLVKDSGSLVQVRILSGDWKNRTFIVERAALHDADKPANNSP